MKYENRNGICIIALAMTLSLAMTTQSAFAVELNPMNWGPSQTEKAEARAKKAEQDAWEAKQRLEKAEKEAQLQLEQAKQEAASRQEEAEAARKEAVLRKELKEKSKASRLKEFREEESKQAQFKTEKRRQQAVQEDSDRDAARETKAAVQERKPEQKKVAQKHKSIWNPLSWFGGSEQPQQQATSVRKEPAQAMVMQSSEAQELSETITDDDRALVARGRKERESTVVLPEGVKADDARYYEEARKMRAAMIETQRGNVVIELYPDVAPITVTNFVKLTSTGFYNQLGMKFHRVVPGFVVQTGDPTGTGAGGSKERIPLEAKNRLSHDAKGVVAMARGASPDSATSQFYITLAPQKMLDAKYAIFGRVIQGFDVLEKIEKDDRLYGVKLVDERTITREDPNAANKQSLLKKIF